MRATAFLCIAALFLTACSPRLTALEIEALAREVPPMLTRHAPGPLPREVWPASVVAISPKAVRVGTDGLYITTWSLFVQERGIFIPNAKGNASASRGSDPELQPLSNGVFSYKIAG
jgi:hypothetical protein